MRLLKFPSFAAKLLIALAIAFIVSQLGTPRTAAITKTVSNSANYQVETRCGWFVNPTPGNAWLNDKDGEWIIGTQGGHQAEGEWPVFGRKQWIKTNGSYGYGCACMKVIVNRDNVEGGESKRETARPLAECRKDPALSNPGR